MGYQPTDVYLKDQLNRPVVGVLVRVFNPEGTVFFTQGTTDTDGKASFLLFAQPYSMRFYKVQVGFQQPQLFEVLDTGPNAFNVTAEVFIPPISNDIRLCRASGYFRSPDGSAEKYLDLHFYPSFSPLLLETSAVVPREVDLRTDEDGYGVVDLIRCGMYRVVIEGMENEERFIRVPDLSGTNLPDLLYAVVARVTFDPPGPYALTVGGELIITPTVFDSAGAVLTGSAQSDVDWTMGDRTVANVTVGETTLRLTGSAPGTTALQAARSDLSIVKIPNLPIDGQPAVVTVT